MRKADPNHATLYLRVTNKTYDRIAQIAKERQPKCSIAALVEMVLMAWLKRRGPKP